MAVYKYSLVHTLLIENTVQFKNLGLVVIDEQHRFGVAQRAKLWQKNENPPHVLVMTAHSSPHAGNDRLWRFRCICY